MSGGDQKNRGVLVAGSVVLDTIVRPCDNLMWGTTTFVEAMHRSVGGNGANTARALARLGGRVHLAGVLGNDEPADWLARELHKGGVLTSALRRVDKPNAATVVLVNSRGDRQFLHRLGSSEEAFDNGLDVPAEVLADVTHYHQASLFVLPHLRTRAPEMLRHAKEAGCTTSLDTNWDPRGEWSKVLEPCLPYADILFLNEDESMMLTGTAHPEAAARWLQAKGAQTVVQKLGGEGCIIYPCTARGGRRASVRCAPFVVDAIDSTGAGDCFAAGFLLAWLDEAPLESAGALGNAAGALSVRAVGSVAGLLSLDETRQWMQTAERGR